MHVNSESITSNVIIDFDNRTISEDVGIATKPVFFSVTLKLTLMFHRTPY